VRDFAVLVATGIIPEGETVVDIPLEHRRSIRTTNSLERIYKEIRGRTRVVGVFPNEASCLRLVSALLMEISQAWQISKHYYCVDKSLNC
jgi:transposase-like protein